MTKPGSSNPKQGGSGLFGCTKDQARMRVHGILKPGLTNPGSVRARDPLNRPRDRSYMTCAFYNKSVDNCYLVIVKP